MTGPQQSQDQPPGPPTDRARQNKATTRQLDQQRQPLRHQFRLLYHKHWLLQHKHCLLSDKPWRLIIVICLAALASLGIWTATRQLAAQLGARSNNTGIATYLTGTDICCLAQHKTILYAGGSDGLFAVDRASQTEIEVGSFTYVNALLSGPDGLWIGCDEGLTFWPWIEGTQGTRENKIGETASGISSLPEPSPTDEMRSISKPSPAITSAANGLAPAPAQSWNQDNGLPDQRVRALLLDHRQQLWVGTWGGAVCLQVTTNGWQPQQTITKADGLLDSMVNTLAEDGQGGLWFGSYVAPRGGLSIRYADGHWQTFSTADGLAHANLNAIIRQPDGSMLTGGGLYTRGGATELAFADGQWFIRRQIRQEDGLAGAKVRSLCYDDSGQLWIGSEYSGLAIFSPAGLPVRRLARQNGLADNEVKVILPQHGPVTPPDDRPGIWIGTLQGLNLIPAGSPLLNPDPDKNP